MVRSKILLKIGDHKIGIKQTEIKRIGIQPVDSQSCCLSVHRTQQAAHDNAIKRNSITESELSIKTADRRTHEQIERIILFPRDESAHKTER